MKMNKITIEQITYFFAIEQYRSFSLAAEELCISQSSLSKQIKALESELGAILFNRSTRTLTLTPAGTAFIPCAKQFLHSYQNIFKEMRPYALLNSAKNSVLNIGTLSVLTQYGLTSILASFKKSHPNIDINIMEEEQDAVLSLLEKSQIDIAITRDFGWDLDLFNIYPLIPDELVVVTSKNHRFNHQESVSFEDLLDERLIMSNKSNIYKLCKKEFKKLGKELKVAHNINKIETFLGFVSEGLGVTLMFHDVLLPFENSNITVHSLNPKIYSNLSLVTRKDTPLSLKSQQFLSYLQRELT